MTNILLSLVLGLWLLVVVAFYAWIAGAVLCRILADLKQAVLSLTRRRISFHSPPAGHRSAFAARPDRATAALTLAGVLVLPAAAIVWPASPLLRCCGLVAAFTVPAMWLLARHLQK